MGDWRRTQQEMRAGRRRTVLHAKMAEIEMIETHLRRQYPTFMATLLHVEGDPREIVEVVVIGSNDAPVSFREDFESFPSDTLLAQLAMVT